MTKKNAVETISHAMVLVMILSERILGFWSKRPLRGSSEQSAIAAKLSMITLIQSNCNTVNGGLTPINGPRNAITNALRFMVN